VVELKVAEKMIGQEIELLTMTSAEEAK